LTYIFRGVAWVDIMYESPSWTDLSVLRMKRRSIEDGIPGS
jgi:hypothetical protein